MSTLCILSYFIFKGTQCGGDLLTILHRSKQKYKEVAEFVGSRRTVRLKKKNTQRLHTGLLDSKVYRLNHEVVLLPAMLVGRSGILQEGENCVLLHHVHTYPACSRRIPGSVQGDKDQISAASLWLQPTQVPCFLL